MSQPVGVEIIINFGALVLGVLYCFFGARLARWLFLMNGFLVSFALTLSPIFHLRTGLAVVLGIAGGIGLAIVFGSAARISRFIMGAVFGALIGAMIDPVATLALAAIAGIASLLFKRPMMILSTSATGAFLIAASIQSWVQGQSVGGMLLARAFARVTGGGPVLSLQGVGALVFLALAGLAVQSLSGRLRNPGKDAGDGARLPEEKPTARSMVRRPSTVPLKPTMQTGPKQAEAGVPKPAGGSVGPETAGASLSAGAAGSHSAAEESDAAPEEALGAHQATWTEDVDVPDDSLGQDELIEAVLTWEHTAPIALAALARFLDSAGTVRARALAVRRGVAPDHRLVTGAFQRELGLGDMLVAPLLLEGAQGRVLLELAEGAPEEQVLSEEPTETIRNRQIAVTRDAFRLSDRRPTEKQIVEGLLRWERTQTGYDVVVVSVLNIQDEPIARALVVATDLGIPVPSLTEEAQRDAGIASPVTAFFQVEGVHGVLLVEI